jgi:hypothetical protein
MTPGTAALAHVREVRAATRAAPDVSAEPGALAVDVARALSFRARATRLDRRLPARSYRQAAYGGLQDTVPRAALAALHARLEEVGPTSWEDDGLVQVWFRCADYVVPEADFGVFTLGALPRDPERSAALGAGADAVSEVLAGQPRRTGELAALPAALARRGLDQALAPGLLLRFAAATARYRIRWDARTVTVIPSEPPDLDPEEARLELARRFLGWHGPAAAGQFAKWAGVTRKDAAETWRRLAPELIPVAVDGRARWLLARDEQALRGAVPPTGVRFLPQGDPYLAIDRALVDVEAPGVPAPTRDGDGVAVSRRLVNSLIGRVLVDGHVRAAWGRERERMAIHLWRRGDPPDLDRIVAEAERFAGPIGRPMRLRLLT